MKKILILLIVSISAQAQSVLPFSTPPPRPYSTFNDASAWWRADTYSGSPGSYVFTDISGNSHPMGQNAGTLTSGTGVNGQARFTGNSSAYLTSNLAIESWPITVITIAVRANNATAGFFGHVGASGFGTLWNGYETSNANVIYNTSASSNTTSEAGSIACYVAKIGYGSRITLVNGVIQSTMSAASIVRSAAIATTLGTQYRGLNLDWYETIVWNRTLSLSDLDEVHAYVNSRYGMSIPLWSSYTAAPTILKSGQSNAAGRGDRGVADVNIPSPYNVALTGCNIWYGTPVGGVGTAFSTLDVTADNHMLGDGSLSLTYFGDELSSTKDYITANGGSVYMVKFAQGGTPLGYVAASNYWGGVDQSTAPNSGFRLYTPLLTNWWKAVAAMQASGLRPVMLGIDWYQGEQDATNLGLATAYESNLTSFITELRKEIGFSAETARFFVVRIHIDDDITDQPYRDTVRAAQDNVAATLPNCQLVSVDSYTLRDITHINAAGQIALGQFLATQY